MNKVCELFQQIWTGEDKPAASSANSHVQPPTHQHQHQHHQSFELHTIGDIRNDFMIIVKQVIRIYIDCEELEFHPTLPCSPFCQNLHQLNFHLPICQQFPIVKSWHFWRRGLIILLTRTNCTMCTFSGHVKPTFD